MPTASRALILLVAGVVLPGCTKFDLLNTSVPFWGFERTSDIAYGQNARQKLDVYQPPFPENADVVIFFYGGDWQTGRRQDYRFVAQALTSRGFITVTPDYRLYPEVNFPAFVQDAAGAVRWTHDNIARFGGDPKHVYIMGHSAGAHIAALVSLDPRYLAGVGLDRSAIRGAALLSGPYDFEPIPQDRAVFQIPRGQARPAPDAEPINFADGHAPPLLLIHGTADETVSVRNTERLAERIRAAGGSVQTIRYFDKGHVPVVLAFAGAFRWLAPTLDDVSDFFHESDQRPIEPTTHPATTQAASRP